MPGVLWAVAGARSMDRSECPAYPRLSPPPAFGRPLGRGNRLEGPPCRRDTLQVSPATPGSKNIDLPQNAQTKPSFSFKSGISVGVFDYFLNLLEDIIQFELLVSFSSYQFKIFNFKV